MTAVPVTMGITRRRSLWRRTRNSRTAYLFLIPALLVMAIITFYPLVYQVWMSFTSYGLTNLKAGAPLPGYVGFGNYQRILSNNIVIPNFDFLRILVFNLFWALSNVILHVVIGVAVALLLNVEGLKGRRIYRAIYILPVVIPPIIVATVWRNMFDTQYGAINYVLAAIGGVFGLPPSAVQPDWLRSVNDPIPFLPLPLAYFALLAANSWLGWPLNSVVATG